MNKTTNRQHSTNRILIIVGVILLLLSGAYYIFTRYVGSPKLADSLKQQLLELVDKKSKGLYHLNIGSISIDGNSYSAVINKISLSIDSSVLDNLIQKQQQPEAVYSFTLEKLTLNKADIMAYLSTKKAVLNKIDASGGTLTISRLLKNSQQPSGQTSKKSIQESVSNAVDGIQIDTIHADNIDIVYTNLKKQSRTIKNVFLDLYQLAIDSSAVEDKSRIFLSKKMRLSIDSIRFPLEDNNYHLGAKKCIISVGDTTFTNIQELYFRSPKKLSLEKLAAAMDEQKDVFDIKIREIVIGDFNLQAFLEDSSVQANLVILNDPEIAIFRDKSKKESMESKVGKYPHQVIRKLPFSIKIPDILVQGGKISYAEKNEKGDAIGKIQFGKVSGKIGPVYKGLPGPNTIKANLTALFMNKSGMSANFEFPPSNDGRFTASARFSPFPVSEINDVVLPLGNVKLKEGKVTNLNFRVNGNNNSATGTAILNYEHLNIEVMKADNDPGYEKNKLMSMITNSFLLHENNMPGDKNKDAYTVTYQRVPNKSFFNLIWKTVFYSIKANTGIGAKGKDKERARIH